MRLLVLALAFHAAPCLAATCESLAAIALPNVTITTSEARAAGEFTPPGGRSLSALPAFCRVSGSIKPSPDSDIRFEVWLPAAGWNGKFQGVGNGGYAGSISFGGLADAVRNKYASASTDTGHSDGTQSAQWALNHPEKIVDFGHRAIHETAVTAKALISAFYGEAPKRSYFNSCSNGGRQALMEAQRYPADYDGIIAGAPAYDWTNLLSSAASGVKAMLANPGDYLPPAKLPAIQAAALAQCDARDGVTDGVIENPSSCRFDTAVLLCKGAESDSCLTARQVGTLNTIYGGLKTSDGALLFPGLSAGGEAERDGWPVWVTGAVPGKASMFAYGTQFFRNMVYSNPAWDYLTFDANKDPKTARDRVGSSLNATAPDLKNFQARGGKLLLYHGWSDAAIPPLSTIRYYDQLVATMGEQKTNEFVRLYMVPGMQHCGGGAGPNMFDQGGTPHADPMHSIDAALEQWVEKGTAPSSILASKYETNSDSKSPLVATRPLCPWPQVAKYSGSGKTSDATNFRCVK